jgi:hypothetical protein
MSRNIDRILIAALIAFFVSCDSSDKDITAFSFTAAVNPALGSDVDATIAGTSIAATVPAGTDVTSLRATFSTDGDRVEVGSVTQISGTTANDFSNPVAYTVVADDGSTKRYTVTVTVAPSSAKSITTFAFTAADNPELASDVGTTINGTAIAATMPYGTDVTALIATFTTTGASVTVNGAPQLSGETANDFTNPLAYTVTAADGTTRSYTVTVTVAPSSAKELTAFAFRAADNAGLSNDVTATINGTVIAATVPYGTNVTALVATFATTGTGVTVNGASQVSGTTPNDFTAPVAYVVAAADATTKTYTVTVTVAPSPAKDITSFSFLSVDNPGLAADVIGAIDGTAIAVTVPYGTDVARLVATFSTTGASIAVNGVAQVSGTTANDFASPVTYVVTAADGSTQSYTVTVTIAPNAAKAITSYAFLSVDNPGLSADVPATIVGTNIVATVPYGTDVRALVATFATTGASVTVAGVPQTSGATAHDFSTQVLYTVTAADGSTQRYTVTVAIAPSPAKDITSFAFLTVNNSGLTRNVTATITGTAIAARLPAATDVTKLVASFTTTGAGVSVNRALQTSGITANDFTMPVTYVVTAADGTTQSYSVTVTAM